MNNLTHFHPNIINEGTRVIVRVDFNVPLGSTDGLEMLRIDRSIPLLQTLSQEGAKTILVSHRGDDGTDSLDDIVDYLAGENISIQFLREWKPAMLSEIISDMMPGEIILLENIRLFPEEKANDESFAQSLAENFDVYINEAFSASHRAHASIVGIPKFIPGYAGPSLISEVKELSQFLGKEKGSIVACIGGAKFGTKLTLAKKLLDEGQYVILGGALLHPIMKARGMEIGNSLCDESVSVADIAHHERLILPSSILVADNIAKSISEISATDTIFDIDPKCVAELLSQKILTEKTSILWNGPFGYYEGGYTAGSDMIARTICESELPAVVGGGDTLAVLGATKLAERFTFVSTGGGAMLEFLSSGSLVGIDAVSK